MIESTKPHIFFVFQEESSFVKEDLGILSGFSDTYTFRFPLPSKKNLLSSLAGLIFNFIRQALRLFVTIRKIDLIYIWFADYHAFLPVLFGRMFGKPVMTVIGGFDANRLETIGYGVYTSWWRRPLARYVVNNSRILLPVDDSLITTNPEAQHWPEAHPNGLVHNVPGFRTTCHTTPTGYAPSDWTMGPLKRERTVCTVAHCRNMRIVKLKGIDLMIETARFLPGVLFTVVGVEQNIAEEIHRQLSPPENVTLAPPVPRKNLNDVYHAGSVYLQLSRAEGLPNVLCEAMLCGCIPVGSAVFGIPTGIGSAGFIAEKPDPEEIAVLVNRALEAPSDLRKKARKHIEENFSLEKRKKTLLRLSRALPRL